MFSAKKSNIYHFLSILFIVFGSIVFGIVQGLGVDFPPIVPLVFSQVVLVFGPVLIYFLTQRDSLTNSLYLKNPGIVNLAMSALLVLTLIPTVSLLNVLSLFFVRNQIADTVSSLTDSPYLLVLLILAVCPGIFEELSTRFILLNNYRHKPYYVACIFSGLFFGMLHLNINQFIYAFVLGAVFAFVVQITESIYTSVLMHTLLNATTFSLSYFLSSSLAEGTLAEAANTVPDLNDVIALLGVNAITLPLAVFILIFLINYNGKRGVLKQKPTVLELTLGRKLRADADVPVAFNFPETGSALPAQPIFSGAPVDAFSRPYETDSSSPFNWAFWSSVILFLALTFLNEFASRMMP